MKPGAWWRGVAAAAGALILAGAAQAEPAGFDPMFTDHAVLQRDRSIEVWGRAGPGERLTLDLAGQNIRARADKAGRWRARFEPLPAGGPYELKLTGAAGDGRSLSDVMVGDVWLCSGQSNMEFPVRRGLNSETEIGAAAN